MRIGDTVESGIWVTGEEPPELRRRYEEDVTEAISYLCEEEGFLNGRVTFSLKHPMDADVPEVPDHIQGDKVRLLVGESEILSIIERGSFVNTLEPEDLSMLRSILRKYQNRS